MEPGLRPWSIDESDFPYDGSISAKLAFLVGYAVLSPSGHNTQPWLFSVRDDTLELRADLSRSLPEVDPADRELIISCGAALRFAAIAARHFGFEAQIVLQPDGESPDLLARLRLGPAALKTELDNMLFAAIRTRRTNRLQYEDRRPPAALLEEMGTLVEIEEVELRLLREGFETTTAVSLIAEGDRLQYASARFRQELSLWLRPNHSESLDGMPGYAHGVGDLSSRFASAFMRHVNIGAGQARKDRRLAEHGPVLAVLTTSSDTRTDWLRTGQALANTLLQARAHDVWASFFSQPLEVASLRSRLQLALGSERVPQMLFRLGYGTDVRPTPRRPREQVLR